MKITGVKVVHDGWGKFLIASVRLDNGDDVFREIEDHGPIASVLAYDPERRVALLVSQRRAPPLHAGFDEPLLEAIAGRIEDTDAQTCARREAMEEAGVRLGALELAGACWSTPGVSTERAWLYLAAFSAADQVEAGGGLSAEHEFITVHTVPLSQLARLADTGQIVDMKTLLLLQTLRLRQPALFA